MKKAPVRKGHHYYHTDTIIGNIFIVSLVFGIAFYISDIPLYLAFILVGLHLRLLRSVLNFMLIAVKKWKGFQLIRRRIMAVDMKEMIAQETSNLLFDKKVKKLTVKDIVDACHITRQAFYYHFTDIPELLKWMLEQKGNELLLKYAECNDTEEQLRCFFTTAVNARPVLKKGLESNYANELEILLIQNMQAMLYRIAARHEAFQNYTPVEQDIIIRYHCQATIGILRYWTDEDTKNLDQIVHAICQMISKELVL